MAKLFRILLLMMFFGKMTAQQVLNFERCSTIAIQNNLQLKRNRLDAATLKINLDNAYNRLLPTANGYATGSTSWGRGIDPFTNIYTNQNFNVYNAGLNVNLNLFNGGADINQIKLQKNEISHQLLIQQKAQNDLTIDLFSKYIQSLYFQELYTIAEHQIELSIENLKNTTARIEKGQLAKNEKYKISAQLESEKWNAINLKNQWDNALMELRFLMNYDSIFVLESIDILPVPYEGNYESLLVKSEKNYPPLQSRELEIKRAEYNQKIAKADYYPKLNLGFNTGTTYSTFNRFMDFGQQIENNWNKQIQLQAIVPIFNQFSVRNKAKQAEMSTEIAAVNKDIENQNFKRIMLQAYNNLNAAYQKFKSSESHYQSQEINLKNDKIRYDVGRISANEFNLTKQNYQNALSSYIRDKYEWYIQYFVVRFYAGELR